MSWSNGVRPVRKSPLPDSGRRSRRRSNCSTLMPASAPLWALKLAVPLSVLVTANTEEPDPSILSAMLPRPSSRRMPKTWARQLRDRHRRRQRRGHGDAAIGTGQTDASLWPCRRTPATSPIVTSSLPPRMFAATAVRPSCALAILTLRAEMRRSRSKSAEAVQRDRELIPVALVGGQEVNAGNIRRDIERVGGERALARCGGRSRA